MGDHAAQPGGGTQPEQPAAAVACEVEVQRQDLERMNMAKKTAKRGLYANINARRRAGTSRPKSKSTVSPSAYRAMKRGFK
jgi:hypothetical protein